MNVNVVRQVAVAVQVGIPVLLHGDPGVGKTSMLRAIARALGRQLHILELSLLLPEDIGGIPYVSDGIVRVAPPHWLVGIEENSILLLDDLGAARPATLNAALGLILERRAGVHTLPSNTAIVAATNSSSQYGNADIPLPVLTRMVHVEVALDVQAWAEGVIAGFPIPNIPVLPTGWEEHIPTWRARIAAFARAMGHAHPSPLGGDEIAEGDHTVPTPRGWYGLGLPLLAACDATFGNAMWEVAFPLLCGAVGRGAAAQFRGWVETVKLPTPQELLQGAPLPSRPEEAWAALAQLAQWAANSSELPTVWEGCWEVIVKALSLGAEDIAVPAMRTLAQAGVRNRLRIPTEALKRASALLRDIGIL